MTEQEAREIAEKIKEFLKANHPVFAAQGWEEQARVKVIACDENWFPLEVSFAE